MNMFTCLFDTITQSELSKQMLIFDLCSTEHDSEIMFGGGDAGLSALDFSRIMYILFSLGFDELAAEFFSRNICKIAIDEFEEYMRTRITDLDIKRYEKWLEEFCMNAPTERMKSILYDILSL